MTILPSDDATADNAGAALEGVRRSVNRLLAAIMAISILVAIAGLWMRYSEAAGDVRRDAANMAEVLSEYLAIRLSAVDGALSKLIATSRRVGGPEGPSREWVDVIRTAMSGVHGLSSLVVTDVKGTIVYSTILQIRGLDWSGQPVFRLLQAGHPNQLAAAAPMRIAAGDQSLVPIGRALTDPQGQFIGAAIATLAPGQLRDFGDSFDLGASGMAWVLLQSGEVLFRQASAGPAPETDAIDPPRFAAEGALGENGAAIGPLVAGGPNYLTAYRKVRTANLVVAVSIAESDFLPSWRYEVTTVALLVVFGAVLLLVARRKILNGLADAGSELHGGELPSDGTGRDSRG